MTYRQLVLDTETTGLRPEEGHRVIEIACIELLDRKLTNNHYHCYLNPEREIDQAAINVHGLTLSFLKDKPRFADIADDFLTFIDGAELIIHNAPFDIGFLNHELKLWKKEAKRVTDYCSVIDTLMLAREKYAGQRNSLDALCKRLGVDNSKRDLHGAMVDTHLLAQVYLAMTGGQGNFFDAISESTSGVTSQRVTQEHALSRAFKVPLSVLSPEEQAAHDQYLATLLSKGRCLWKEE